jgi:hypothetical protein
MTLAIQQSPQRWNRLGSLPRKGWRLMDVEDGEEPDYECEACGTNIRYMHVLAHLDVFHEIRVGCICCEHLTEDPKNPKARERRLKAQAKRREAIVDDEPFQLGSAPADKQPDWIDPCPLCGKPAECRFRPDTKMHWAEIKCPACHHHRWLKKPEAGESPPKTPESPPKTPSSGEDSAMATATATNRNAGVPQDSSDADWTMEATSGGGGGGDFAVCPAGNHPGTIVHLFDLGIQTTSYAGQEEEKRQIAIVVELAKKKPNGDPFVMAERYNWSLNEKAAFRGMVESVTGLNFDDGSKFNPVRDLLGKPVMIMVTNSSNGKEGKDARTYANIKGLSQFPENFPAPEPTLPIVKYRVQSGQPFPAGLDWLKDARVYGKTIEDLAASSKEVRERALRANAGAVPQAEARTAESKAVGDDAPF